MTYELIEAKRTKPRSAFQAVRRALSAVLCTAVLAGLAVVAVACLHGGFLGAITSPWMFQYLIAFCVAAALTLVCGARRTFLLGLIGILWTGALAVPAMIASPPTSRQGAASAVRCRVLDANVLYGNPPSEEALAWIADTDADVVVLVECSERWAAAMNKLTARYPHQLVRPANDPRGISLYSRHRISAQAVRRAPAGVLPFLDVIVHLPDAEVRVVAVHPVAPSSPRAVTSRNAELAWLAEQCAATELPLIVTGDFNETPYGAAYRLFERDSGLVSARGGFGRAPTWPSQINGRAIPEWLRIPIDHCFASAHFTTTSFTVGPHIGSDHRPIVIDLACAKTSASPVPSAPLANR